MRTDIKIIIWRQMQIENDSQDDFYGVELLHRNQKSIPNQVKKASASEVSQLASKAVRKIEINSDLDPQNQANKSFLAVKPRSGNFQHLMMKNQSKGVKTEVLQVVRNQLREHLQAQKQNIDKMGWVTDNAPEQILVVRFIQLIGESNVLNKNATFTIEDKTGRASLLVNHGIAWVGMIAAIETVFVDNMYRLKSIVSLGKPVNNIEKPIMVKNPNSAYRMVMLKGPFRKNSKKNDFGSLLLFDQLLKLSKYRSGIDCVVIMGPILSVKNSYVENCELENTFEEEFITIVQIITEKVQSLFASAKVFLIPSTQDVTNLYPIPQQKYPSSFPSQGLHYLNNPATVDFQQSNSGNFSINFINYDLLQYIDQNKGGPADREVLTQNYETYFKQPFILSNTIDEPFDEVNLPELYNAGNFSDIIVVSSKISPPYARIIQNRLVVNIGSLGMDQHDSGKHYITLMSIYQGDGPVCRRTKFESITM